MENIFKPHKKNIYNFTKTEIATKDGMFATVDGFIDRLDEDGCIEVFKDTIEGDYYVRYFFSDTGESVFLCHKISDTHCPLINFDTPMEVVKWLNGLDLGLCVLCVVMLEEVKQGCNLHKLH